MITKVSISVPATTANLGAGFDTFGLALNLRSIYTVELSSKLEIHFEGREAEVLEQKSKRFIYRILNYFAAEEGITLPPLKISVLNNIPLTRGLGSSASAILAILSCLEVMINMNFDKDKVLRMASLMEGHPDNVTASMVGGFVVALIDKREIRYIKRMPRGLQVALAIPDFFLQTREARAVLPETYKRSEAVYNISRASFLASSIILERYDLLPFGFGDRIHEPYRAGLIPGFYNVINAAIKAGAYGGFLSGAGSTVAALIPEGKKEVTDKMVEAFKEAGVKAEGMVLDISNEGIIFNPQTK